MICFCGEVAFFFRGGEVAFFGGCVIFFVERLRDFFVEVV